MGVLQLNARTAKMCVMLMASIVFVGLTNPVSAARCQIGKVSYVYPHQAAPSQQIRIDTLVAGSCLSNGEDYYAVRVDLVDQLSNSIISSGNTPIGYGASNFTVAARNLVTTPSRNATWSLRIYVYVIRAGGTNGAYLLDYTTIGNVTVQVGAIAVPEFQTGLGFITIVALSMATLGLHRLRRREES